MEPSPEIIARLHAEDAAREDVARGRGSVGPRSSVAVFGTAVMFIAAMLSAQVSMQARVGALAHGPAVAVAGGARGVTRHVAQRPAVNPAAAAVSAFDGRLKAYVELRQKVVSTVPPLQETPDPAAIAAYERALAEAVRRARAGAKAGDLFGRDMTPLLVQIIRRDWQARARRDRSALRAEMPQPFVPQVHMAYPASQPFMTFPATLLKRLHQLPDDLEYRFVGRHLILRDVKANLIVDVMRDVLVD